MAVASRKKKVEAHEEHFFVSMTDMMVGMLFMFIIMLMFFAVKYQDGSTRQEQRVEEAETERKRLNEMVDRLTGARAVRDEIVEGVFRSLKNQGVNVFIDKDNGLVRLPESVLFPVNKSELTPEGKEAVKKLALTLHAALACHTRPHRDAPPPACNGETASVGVEAIFVEGHTDSDGAEELNWKLSMERSLHTYQVMLQAKPELRDLMSFGDRNDAAYPVLSIAGYAFKRNIAPNDTAENKAKNRRIDLRFIMGSPKKVDLEKARGMVE